MTKEVLLSIKGLQFEGGEDSDKIEVITVANFYQKNQHYYFVFDEMMEGFQEPVKNILKFNSKELIMNKGGLIKTVMLFEKGKKNTASYRTPYGELLIAIDTDEIELEISEERIKLYIKYALEVNYEHLANCTIQMVATSKLEV